VVEVVINNPGSRPIGTIGGMKISFNEEVLAWATVPHLRGPIVSNAANSLGVIFPSSVYNDKTLAPVSEGGPYNARYNFTTTGRFAIPDGSVLLELHFVVKKADSNAGLTIDIDGISWVAGTGTAQVHTPYYAVTDFVKVGNANVVVGNPPACICGDCLLCLVCVAACKECTANWTCPASGKTWCTCTDDCDDCKADGCAACGAKVKGGENCECSCIPTIILYAPNYQGHPGATGSALIPVCPAGSCIKATTVATCADDSGDKCPEVPAVAARLATRAVFDVSAELVWMEVLITEGCTAPCALAACVADALCKAGWSDRGAPTIKAYSLRSPVRWVPNLLKRELNSASNVIPKALNRPLPLTVATFDLNGNKIPKPLVTVDTEIFTFPAIEKGREKIRLGAQFTTVGYNVITRVPGPQVVTAAPRTNLQRTTTNNTAARANALTAENWMNTFFGLNRNLGLYTDWAPRGTIYFREPAAGTLAANFDPLVTAQEWTGVTSNSRILRMRTPARGAKEPKLRADRRDANILPANVKVNNFVFAYSSANAATTTTGTGDTAVTVNNLLTELPADSALLVGTEGKFRPTAGTAIPIQIGATGVPAGAEFLLVWPFPANARRAMGSAPQAIKLEAAATVADTVEAARADLVIALAAAKAISPPVAALTTAIDAAEALAADATVAAIRAAITALTVAMPS
jgi:hypothetical protein